MKKYIFILTSFLFTGLLFSCNNQSYSEDVLVQKKQISENIKKLKENGYFLGYVSDSRNISSDDEDIYTNKLINETEETLDEVLNSENGYYQFEVINCVFNGGTEEELQLLFSEESNDFANEYYNSTKSIQVSNNNSSRSLSPTVTFFNIDIDETSGRSITDPFENMSWLGIVAYTGFCASTIAGAYMINSGFFWVQVAGFAATIAGGIGMGCIVKKWADESNIIEWIVALFERDSLTATNLLNSDEGWKLITITLITASTVAAVYFSPAGQSATTFAKSTWNGFIRRFYKSIPLTIAITIQGIPLKEI